VHRGHRLSSVTVGNAPTSPTTRYAHNALGQRVFKTEPLYEDIAEEPGDAGFWASLASFFNRLWNPQVKAAEQLGFAYSYDEDGTLIGEYGSGGAQSTGTSQYIWLPTPNGPMPIVAIVNGAEFAVHSDHLNTPRKLTNDQGQPAWQWKYSAFGEELPTRAANRFVDPDKTPGAGVTSTPDVVYNHRYPGQYADKESGLSYNYFRTYDAEDGRYTQSDPIGLDGGWNRFAYVASNPLSFIDPEGLQNRATVTPGGPGALLRWPSIGPNQPAPTYNVNQTSANRGSLSSTSANLLNTFSVNANGPIVMRTDRAGGTMFETVTPNGTRLVYRSGQGGPRLDIYAPGGARETLHPIGGACLR
jgi:RHS repeat-associated protein